MNRSLRWTLPALALAAATPLACGGGAHVSNGATADAGSGASSGSEDGSSGGSSGGSGSSSGGGGSGDGSASGDGAGNPATETPIQHVVVIVKENHTFDN